MGFCVHVVSVPDECVGRIIGFGGEKLRKLMQSTNCAIQCIGGRGNVEKGFYVAGESADCDRAVASMKQTIADQLASLQDPVYQMLLKFNVGSAWSIWATSERFG